MAELPESLDLLSLAVSELGGEPRAGQQEMVSLVDDALNSKHHLAIQAGTGTGKSLGYLVPAARFSVEHDKPVVVSTATLALQRQLVDRDLPNLAESLGTELGRPLNYAILKGRNNYLCKNKISTGSQQDLTEELPESKLGSEREVSAIGAQVKRLYEWANVTKTGDRDDLDTGVSDQAWAQLSVNGRECIGASKCPFGEQCFAEQAKLTANDADIIVTNHTLLALDMSSDNVIIPEHDVVIIDEAHDLESRVTQASSGELSAVAVAIIGKRINKFEQGSADKLLTTADQLAEALEALPEAVHGRWLALPGDVGMILTQMQQELASCSAVLSKGGNSKDLAASAERQACLVTVDELHESVNRIIKATRPELGADDQAQRQPDTEVVWYSDEPRRVIRVAPLSVSSRLRFNLFDEDHTVVLTSATLELGGNFRAMLASWGMNPQDCLTKDVGTPFDPATHGILYSAADLPAPRRNGASAESIDELAQLINAAGGRTLGLFSSRRAAELAAHQLKSIVPYEIHCQGEDALGALVEKFAADESSCLFGTLGLWQGVDVPGPSLSLVVIDRIPFPRPDDPLLQARQEAATEAGRNGFMEVSASHAALLMAQGSGRLLRSKDDRGVVAVLDSRLATKRYGSFLINSMPPFWKTTSLETSLKSLRRLTGQS